MKKLFCTLFLMCMMLFPMVTNAEEYEKVNLENYKTMNLIETLESEEIEVKLENYKESEDQVTIYLFRGTGCAYCRAFLNFLNDLDAEYYNKIKVVSFDAWYDEESALLLESISAFLEQDAGGVPYIIIGDSVFPGYAADYDESIKATIDAQYNLEEKYDVIEEYNDYIDELQRKEMTEKVMPIIWNGMISVICAVAVILYVSYSNSRLLYVLKGGDIALEKELETFSEEVDKIEELEEVKKERPEEKPHKSYKNKNNKNQNKPNQKINK